MPIISFESIGSKTLIKSGTNGYLIKCYDTKKYAEKIIKIYKSKNKVLNPNFRELIKYDLSYNSYKTVEDYKYIINN